MTKATTQLLQEKIHYALFIFTTGIFIYFLFVNNGHRTLNFMISAPWLVFALLHIVSIHNKLIGGIGILLLSLLILYFNNIFALNDIVGFFLFFALALFQLVFGLLIMISGLFYSRN